MTLWFDVVNSPSLSPEQKELIQSRVAARISKEGTLRVISQQTRSQVENKELAIERFSELLQDAPEAGPHRKKKDKHSHLDAPTATPVAVDHETK